LNEATSGKLFDLRRDRPFDVHLEEVTPAILKVAFFEYVQENGNKRYTTENPPTVTVALPVS
jgi:hypothetical protein